MERNKTLRVCLDTNVFIAVKNREEGYEYCERILDAIDDGLIEAFVSPIVISEVLVGYYRNKEEIEAKKFLEHLLQRYKVRNVDIEVAKISAKLRETGLKLPDAIITATAMLVGAILVSKDYEIKIPQLEVLDPKEFVEKYSGVFKT